MHGSLTMRNEKNWSTVHILLVLYQYEMLWLVYYLRCLVFYYLLTKGKNN